MEWRFPVTGDVLARRTEKEEETGAAAERMRGSTGDQPCGARAEKSS
jgi:hypothetical protein